MRCALHAAYAKQQVGLKTVFTKVRDIDYCSLVGFLILEALCGDKRGEMRVSSVQSHTGGVADSHQPSPAPVQALP